MTGTGTRAAELAANLATVRSRIEAACTAAGRDPAELTLIAVTKTYPAADVLELARLGVRDVGENRDQEASAKAAEVASAVAAHGLEPVRWHFVGRLQRNKCRSVVRYADLVHSVDSVRLAAALGAAAAGRDRPLGVLIQVSVDGDPARGGAPLSEVDRVADEIAAQPSLRLRGVMTVAPMPWRPGDAFARLAGVAEALRARYPGATVVSAGMSGDFAEAIAHGATHLRIGSALLGNRAPLR